MTYPTLKAIINESYANFCKDYIVRQRLGAVQVYSKNRIFFVKSIYNTLMNQDGNESLDTITKINIQDCIKLFNKYSNSTIPVEYE